MDMSKNITIKAITISSTNICTNSAVTVNLASSQAGVQYQLYKNSLPVAGTILLGDGSNKSWAVDDIGTYYIRAVSLNGYCANVNMTGTHTLAVSRTLTLTADAIKAVLNYPVTFSTTVTPVGGTYSWNGGGTSAAKTTNMTTAGVSATVTYKIGTYTACSASASASVTYYSPCPYSGSDLVAASCFQASDGAQNWRAKIQDTRISGTTEINVTEGRKYYNIVQMPDNKWWLGQNLDFRKNLSWSSSGATPGGGTNALGYYWCPGARSSSTSSLNACNTYGALYNWETAMSVDGKCYNEDLNGTGIDCTPSNWITPPPTSYCTATPSSPNCKLNNGRGNTKRGICPSNWHVPTFYEWALVLDKSEGNGEGTTFQNCPDSCVGINDATGVGARLKSADVCASGNCATDNRAAWSYFAEVAGQTNDYFGFTVVPAGRRYPNSEEGAEVFSVRGHDARLGSSTIFDEGLPRIDFSYGTSAIRAGFGVGIAYGTYSSLSYRCIHD
jgi:uncharacterized protein (TIGR02145 family)